MHKLSDLEAIATRALMAAGAGEAQATSTAKALVIAESQGLGSHGLSRVAMYAGHLRNKRVMGSAKPHVKNERSGAVLIDAENGFAFPACDLAIDEAISRARTFGISIAAVCNSHHFGAAGMHLERAAKEGMVAIGMGNSPAAMPFAGGKKPIFGTNPIAACFPRANAWPLLIDLSLSEVARGKIMVAAKEGKPIPLGWALDAEGNPTTDAQKALTGSMLAFGSSNGGVKGAMLALMVELLVTSLTGAHFGAEADSFFVDEGNQPRIGQAFIVIDPNAMAGQVRYFERVESLVEALIQDSEIRLPGERRFKLQEKAYKEGLEIPKALFEQLEKLAASL